VQIHVWYGVALAAITFVSWRLGGGRFAWGKLFCHDPADDRIYLCLILWYNWLCTNAAALTQASYYPFLTMFVIDGATWGLIVGTLQSDRARIVGYTSLAVLTYDITLAAGVSSLGVSPALDWLRMFGYFQMLLILLPEKRVCPIRL